MRNSAFTWSTEDTWSARPVRGIAYRQSNLSYDEPAGFWLRFFAWIFDSVFIGIITSLIVFMFLMSGIVSLVALSNLGALGLDPTALIKSSVIGLVLFATVLPTAIVVLYGTFFEASILQATPGKLIMGLVVTDYNGNQLSPTGALKRNLAKLLGTGCVVLGVVLTAISLGFGHGGIASLLFAAGGTLVGITVHIVGHLKAAFGEYKQALHDEMAEALVNRDPAVPAMRRVWAAIGAVALLIFIGSCQSHFEMGKHRLSSDSVWRNTIHLNN